MHLTIAVLTAAILTMPVAGAYGQGTSDQWIGTWFAATMARAEQAPSPTGASGQSLLHVHDQTLRQITRITLGGSRFRIAIANTFGNTGLKIGAATIALRHRDAAIAPPSVRTLTFGGAKEATVPAGAVLTTDPVDLTAPDFSDLAIDLYLPGDTAAAGSPITMHAASWQTGYLSTPGNHAGLAALPVEATTRYRRGDGLESASWFFLTRIEVLAPPQTRAIVAIGDSLTDGTASGLDANNRWPDHLARRLAGAGTRMPVLNAGIGGNRVLADGNGPAALARFERDVLAQPGVAAVIVLEGINDIGQARTNPSPSAADLIAGHQQLIDRARARGLRVYGATLTPFAGANYWTAEGEAKRQALNDWIRTARAYDGVIDADAVVRDAANPAKLRAEYDASDHLHLNAAGYEAIAGAIDLAALTAPARPRASGTAVLFIGNSFTFGAGSPVQTWRAETVTDLNHEKIGGVPALFESFTKQAGLDYDVSLETHPGVGLDYHLQMKRDALTSRPWDVVVMHGQSTLDFDKPGDPAKLIATTRQMADVLTGRSPGVRLYLTATWSRADQTYVAGGRWYGQPIAAMARDVRAAYDKAAQTSPAIKAVIPVGEAWLRAIDTGIADPNPYDGITPGQLDLWAKDHYHASTEGYYLEALMVFGALTGRDPRSLGEGECSAFELGMTTTAVRALQQVAFDQLSAARTLAPAPAKPARPAAPARCSP